MSKAKSSLVCQHRFRNAAVLRKVCFFTDKVLNLTNLTFWLNIHCTVMHLWKGSKEEINTASSIF